VCVGGVSGGWGVGVWVGGVSGGRGDGGGCIHIHLYNPPNSPPHTYTYTCACGGRGMGGGGR